MRFLIEFNKCLQVVNMQGSWVLMMFLKFLPQQEKAAISLMGKHKFILGIKHIALFTILHFYFSDPVTFNADHLFEQVNSA